MLGIDGAVWFGLEVGGVMGSVDNGGFGGIG